MRVNSSHHQSVKAVAPSLIASALASDGIVEAIESPTHRFFLGIQWHPEFLFDRHPLHRRLFEAFLRAARAADRDAETRAPAALSCLCGLFSLFSRTR